jgi:hypothetical protein
MVGQIVQNASVLRRIDIRSNNIMVRLDRTAAMNCWRAADPEHAARRENTLIFESLPQARDRTCAQCRRNRRHSRWQVEVRSLRELEWYTGQT